MPRYTRIGITGANGRIGRVLLAGLGGDYDIRAITRREVDFPATVASLTDQTALIQAFTGLEAVIHLGANPSPRAPWEDVRDSNIEGMYCTLEACRQAGVKRLIFASTNHTQHGNTIHTTPETLDRDKKVRMKTTDPPNPDSLYAVSKLFGENLGKLYSEQHNLEFIILRIGWLIPENDPTTRRGTPSEEYMRAMFLSHRDCVEAHRKALEVDARFLIAYAISGNTRRVFNLAQTARDLGFFPQNNAETYF